MWKRMRRETFAQELYDTADDLRTLGQQLMELSVVLNKQSETEVVRSTTRMVLTLQERETRLRQHADRLTKTGNLGRRATDVAAEAARR